MKLTDVIKIDEERIVAALKNGKTTSVYKNPTQEELNKVALNGVVKGILSRASFIAYDFQNIDTRDLPPINGYPIVMYIHHGNNIVIEAQPYTNISEKQLKDLLQNHPYFSKFDIRKVMVHNETE